MSPDLAAQLDTHFRRWSRFNVDFAKTACAKFVAEWAGIELPEWETTREAQRVLRSHFAASRTADVANGLLQHLPATARPSPGDIVALSTPPFDTFGICVGSESVFLGPGHLLRKPTRHCSFAWKVDR